MATSVTTTNTRILEIPVTIQGAQTVEGEERRELFTETTKTSLVFEKGAVVNLKARVTLGQCVFLRNEQTGREMLCKVLELRRTGDVNCSDLEFTGYAPDFWDSPAEKPAAPRNEVQEKIDRAVQSLGAASIPQPAPVSETTAAADAPAAASSTPAATTVDYSAPPKEDLSDPSEPAPTTIASTAHEPSASSEAIKPPESAAVSEPVPVSHAEPDDEKDSAQLAALMALDDRKRAKRDAATKAKEDAAAAAVSAASQAEAHVEAVASAEALEPQNEAGSEPVAIPAPRAKIDWKLLLVTGKRRIAAGIAASFLIVAALGIAWHGKRGGTARGSTVHASNVPSSAWSGAKQPATPAGAQPSPVSAPAAGPAATAVPNSASAVPANPSAPVSSPAPISNSSAKLARTSAPVRSNAFDSGVASDASNLSPTKTQSHQRAIQLAAGGIVPPQIISQPQPTFPSWANGTDVDPVVQLDAVIDENGNITETKVLSGPRILQREAEKAVALWMFEPATKNGKPTATHMVLTVEFQR